MKPEILDQLKSLGFHLVRTGVVVSDDGIAIEVDEKVHAPLTLFAVRHVYWDHQACTHTDLMVGLSDFKKTLEVYVQCLQKSVHMLEKCVEKMGV